MTTRTLTRAALAVITMSLVLAAVAAPAHAERWVKRDAAGDVRHHDRTTADPDEAEDGTPAPQHANADLRRTTLRYSRHRVRVVMRFRELDRSQRQLAFAATVYYPHDDGQVYFEVFVQAGRGDWKGNVGIGGEVPGFDTECPARHRIDYARNRVSISFPAACIGAPRWVRFHGAAVSAPSLEGDSFFIDQAIESPGAAQKLSRRIRRG